MSARHLDDGLLEGLGGKLVPSLERSGDDPDTQRLGEHQGLPGLQTRVGEDPGRVDLTDDRQPELGFGIVDGVAARNDEAGGGRDRSRTGQDLTEELVRQFLGVPADQIQSQQRPAAHGVDVGHRVGRGDATPRVGVVDQGGDEVGGDNKRAVVVDLPDGSVVTSGCIDQKSTIVRRSQTAQHVRQVAGGELAGSTSAVAELGQSSGHAHLPLTRCSMDF